MVHTDQFSTTYRRFSFFSTIDMIDSKTWVGTVIHQTWCLLNILLMHMVTLCEKCPDTEFFLVRIFVYSDWIRKSPYISVFCANTGKYRPEKSPYLETFYTVWYSQGTLRCSVKSLIVHRTLNLFNLLSAY